MAHKVLHLGFDGKSYPYRRGGNTARIVRKVREVTGMPVLVAERHMGDLDTADIDVALVLFYAAALQAGEDPNFEALADEVTEVNAITVEVRELDEDPETRGAGS